MAHSLQIQQPYNSGEQPERPKTATEQHFSGESSPDSHCQQVFTEHLLCLEQQDKREKFYLQTGKASTIQNSDDL